MKRWRRKPEAAPPGAGEAAGDGELVGRAVAGERAAFDVLVRRYERRALAVAYRLLNNGADSQETVQDALLAAYRALDTLASPERFGPWLLRIVTNLSLNLRRSRARRPTVSLDDSARRGREAERSDEPLAELIGGKDAPPDRELMTAELEERIRRALDELPDRQRAALTLFSAENMSQREVAEIIGCSVEAVKWHVFAARKKLKQKLADLLEEKS